MPQLSPKLTENLALLDEMFGSSADFYSKEVELYHCRGALVLFDGMASLESLWELLLDAVSRRTPALDETPGGSAVFDLLLHHSGLPAESSPVETLDDLTRRLTAGMAVLLLDGCAQGIVFSVQSLKFRSVEEPAGEGNLRGSREGFADLLRVNLSLLRRLIRTEQLVQEVTQADCETRFATAREKSVPERLRRYGRSWNRQSRSCCWIPAILCPGSFRAASGCFLRSAIPSARRWRRQNSARGKSLFWSMAAPLP